MKDFFKTFGLGLLYFILFPFLLCYLIIMGIYLLFKDIFYIFLYKNKKYKKKVKDNEIKAQAILNKNRYKEDVKEEKNDVKLEDVNPNNVTYNTTNNIIITNMDSKEVKKKLASDPNYFLKLARNNENNDKNDEKYIESQEVNDDFLLDNKNETTLEDDDPTSLKESIKESIKEERIDMSSLKRED